MYQMLVKVRESRNSDAIGPLSYPTSEDRDKAARGPDVYWYHYVEEDDWFLWKRGGAWTATHQPGPAERVNEPPEVTEDDRW